MTTLKNKTYLVTGGTGSFGKQFIAELLRAHDPKKIIVFSRDELKQYEMQIDPRFNRPDVMRYFLGDVRDRERLSRAFDGVDYVIHAAALKQVPAAEYNPFEVIKTNVYGAQNIIEAAIDKGIKRVVALSTDKAASPINLYGATKLCSDKLFVAGNAYSGTHDTRFSVVRYGNVVGSRGSVIPLYLKLRCTGELPITDERMTRFWITLERGVQFVLDCLEQTRGGELFVPKIPSMRMVELADAIAPGCRLKNIGIRPGEKLHEVMVPEDDARSTVELGDRFVVMPLFDWAHRDYWSAQGKLCAEGFRYASDTNSWWLTRQEIIDMVARLGIHESADFAREHGAGA